MNTDSLPTQPEPPIRQVDELRQQLRSLGYLDAGVDRFVLGPARGTRRPAAIAALASVRIGVLAALLLGPAAAIGVETRLPGLITGAGDGFVVAAYLAVLFGAASCGGAFGASLLVSWIATRPALAGWRRRLALVAGAAFTIACLAYLTLWWDASTFSARPGWRSFGTAIPLALAAAISLLLGHAVTVTTLAVAVARRGVGDDQPGVPGSSRRMLAAAGALTFCGALLLFNLTARFDRPPDAPALAVVSAGLRLRVIAIDGFDPDIARRLAVAGRIPALAAALDGATALVLADDTRDPARAWTTMATGQPPEVHAVHALETRRVAGVQGTIASGERSPLARTIGAATDLVRLTRPSVASGTDRRVKTFWEVASSAGLRTATVNWWATWPASPGTGLVVTDRAAIRLERGGELDAEISPPELYPTLRARWPALREEAATGAVRLGAVPGIEGLLQRSAELDALQMGITREVTSGSVDLTCTYLPGLDLVQHGLFTAGDGSPQSASAVAARLAALEEYYVSLDTLLASALKVSAGELVMLLTSPGRVQGHASGLIVLRGPAANTRLRDGSGRPADIMPTVLHALGVPISRELAGRPLVELFSRDFARQYPVREVSRYGPPLVAPSRPGQPLDQEMIDRLRSLGYVR